MKESPGHKIRSLLDRPEILVLPGVYDAIGARLVKKCGFDVVFTSGFGFSATLLGSPDFGLLTATETIESVRRIVRTVDLPVVADIDTGYGGVLNVYRTVQDIVAAGAGGIILEDQVWPKKCGHFEGKRVIPLKEHVDKIQAAVEARGDSGLLIIGRTDARACHGLEDALERGQAYREAGADVIFVEAPESRAELEAIAAAFPETPTFANMIEGGKTPMLSASELQELGFQIVVFPLAGLFSATAAMEKVFRHLATNGSTEGADLSLSFHDFEAIVGTAQMRELEKKLRD